MHVSPEDRIKYALTDAEVLQLAKWGVQIEQHYKKPMDMEWAKDGVSNESSVVTNMCQRIDEDFERSMTVARAASVNLHDLPAHGYTMGTARACETCGQRDATKGPLGPHFAILEYVFAAATRSIANIGVAFGFA